IVWSVPECRRLISVFVHSRPAEPADLSFTVPRCLQLARRYLKPTIVAIAMCGPLVASAFLSVRLRERPPLFGIYQVDRFVRNGDTIPPLKTDSTRWERVVFGRAGVMSSKV